MRTTQCETSLMKAKTNVSQIELRTKTRYRCAQLLFTKYCLDHVIHCIRYSSILYKYFRSLLLLPRLH